MTTTEQLAAAGIKTIRTEEVKDGKVVAYLEHNGKCLPRPSAHYIDLWCLEKFGVQI